MFSTETIEKNSTECHYEKTTCGEGPPVIDQTSFIIKTTKNKSKQLGFPVFLSYSVMFRRYVSHYCSIKHIPRVRYLETLQTSNQNSKPIRRLTFLEVTH